MAWGEWEIIGLLLWHPHLDIGYNVKCGKGTLRHWKKTASYRFRENACIKTMFLKQCGMTPHWVTKLFPGSHQRCSGKCVNRYNKDIGKQ